MKKKTAKTDDAAPPIEKVKFLNDGEPMELPIRTYAKAKAKALRDFGYPDVTEETVIEQIHAIRDKKKFGKGLTIIGMFVQDEIEIL